MVPAFLALAGLAASVSANIYTTMPIASTICIGGQPCPIRWQDSATAPPLSAYGNTLLDIWAGSDTQQVFVFTLGTIDPAKVNSFTPNIPANIAPNGQYFIRYSSVNGRDAAGNPLMAFSTRFSLSGMTGIQTPTLTQDPILLTATPLIGAAGAAVPAVANATSTSLNAVVAAANTNTAPVIVTATSTAPLPPALSSALAAASASTTKKSSADSIRAQGLFALALAAAAISMGL